MASSKVKLLKVEEKEDYEQLLLLSPSMVMFPGSLHDTDMVQVKLFSLK